MMGKQDNFRKNHASFIFEDLILSIKSITIFLLIAFANLNKTKFYVIGIILLFSLKSIIKWANTKFLITNNEVLFQTGLINKRKLEVPFDKINTIDINRNIIDRIFNISTLKIDTGAVKDLGQEIKIKVKEKDAYSIRNYINGEVKESINETTDSYIQHNSKIFSRTITFKEILIYSVSKSKILWALGGIFFLNDLILNIEETFNLSVTNNVVDGIDIEKLFSNGLLKSILITSIFLIVIYLLITIIYIIYEVVRLYDFTITNDINDIKIKYGLLTIKEYSIPKDKIYAIRYKQNLFQQLFKIFQIEVVTIGYGDDKNEQAILFPVANKKFINSTLNLIVPNFKFEGEYNVPTKNVLSRFIFKRSLILIMFFIIPLYFIIPSNLNIIKIIISIILILYNMLLGYINYKNTSLGVNEKLLVTSSGSIPKVTTLIKQEYLQSVEIKENPFQRRKGVCDFKLDIYSNKLGDIVLVKNLNKDIFNNIDKNLIL